MTVPTMSSDPTAEQIELRRKGRQRLIGAVTLALLAAVFIPMLLDPEPREKAPALSLAIPPKDGLPPLASLTPGVAGVPVPPSVAADPVRASDEPKSAPAATAPPTEARQVVAPKAAEFKPPEPRPVASLKAAPKATDAPKLEGFAVQIGAFREGAKLSQAREKLTAARISHYTERVATASGELTRLRAGPYAARGDADRAAADIRSLGLEGKVVPLP